MSFRITYSVLNADLNKLHAEFDSALVDVKKNLGNEFPSLIANKEIYGKDFIENRNPAKPNELLGNFHSITVSELENGIELSLKTQKIWAKTSWQKRVEVIRRAADIISERRFRYAAIMALEVGKTRLECLGDVEESADLFRYYAEQLEAADGFVKPLGKLSPQEDTCSILKPYGVFAVISPFNFPLALACGMSGAALLGGNSVILKPSSDTPWTAQLLFEALRDAGLPDGIFQFFYDRGTTVSEALVRHPQISGLAFTGSKKVGMYLMNILSPNYPKPCLLELGGKNPAIICKSADIDAAVEGCARSAFGLSGQKCSALSRLYVDRSISESFIEKLITKTKTLKVCDPLEKDTFTGPLISKEALEKHLLSLAILEKDGEVLHGGNKLHLLPKYSGGYFADLTIGKIDKNHPLLQNELFCPILLIDTFSNLDEALTLANNSQYGLTAGIFSEDEAEIEYFMDNIESGVLYANRRAGATTGAWPGVQAFCGWKGSGATGKGGCGPYYVSQFMREQSQTRMHNKR